MDPYFSELGQTVLTRWKQANFNLARFPEIATAALEDRPPSDHVDVGELIRSFLLDDRQPFQTQSGFGQPELVVYDDPRFYIQILFWLDGTTTSTSTLSPALSMCWRVRAFTRVLFSRRRRR